MLNAKGIELILVSPPYYWKDFDDVNDNQMTYLYQYINSFMATHNVRYLNLQSDSTFVEEDFADCAHLSEKGAEKFTRKLCEFSYKN